MGTDQSPARDVRLCFVIPASPTDGFRGQIAMFRRSLDALGGIYERARVIAVFGEGGGVVPAWWRPHFERVTTVAAKHADDNGFEYSAQTVGRWSVVPDDCDFAIMADADTLVVRPFDDLLAQLSAEPAVAGSIAHYPFPQRPGETQAAKWASLARSINREIPLSYAYTLMARDPARSEAWSSPFYLNFGFVIVPRSRVDPLGRAFRSFAPIAAQQLANPTFAGQVALTLAIYALGIPRLEMDIKYDFPNDPVAEKMHEASMRDMRVIHYLRTTHFDRQQIFARRAAFDEFLALRLTGSEAIFQEHVARITNSRFPFD